MLPTRRGAIRLFEFAGINVFLHWSWFAFAAFRISYNSYSSVVWAIWEYLFLFAIVLMHEFGHALACRSVGGRAHEIILWPLGGVAFVSPPQRPGATLWSIAAGPLVNVVLCPILVGGWLLSKRFNLDEAAPNAYLLIRNTCIINTGLLVFNCLPIYPLDGGQILRSILWFICGRARSLLISTVVGLVGAVAIIILALVYFGWDQDTMWLCFIFGFALMNSWKALQEAMALLKLSRAPKNAYFACPSCKTAPPQLPIWLCQNCGTRFDMFYHFATCPGCGSQFPTTVCIECGVSNPVNLWMIAPPPPRPINVPPIFPGQLPPFAS